MRRPELQLMIAILLNLCASGAVHAQQARPHQPKKLVTMTAENLTANRQGGPTTFGLFFAQGDVTNTVRIDELPTQVDIKRRWDDGSVKHAVVTVNFPPLGPKERKTFSCFPTGPLDTGPPVPVDSLKKIPNVKVVVQIHNGPTRTANLRSAIAAGPIRTWLQGELVTEYHFKMAPRGGKNNQPDPDLMVRFRVRVYPSSKSARVTVVVENTWMTTPGGIPYNVKILRGKKEIFSQKQVGKWPEKEIPSQRRKVGYFGHGVGARWVKRFWVGSGKVMDGIHIRYDRAYMNQTGLLPRYDLSLRATGQDASRWTSGWNATAHGILQNGSITPFFGRTGGRADIGPLPLWATLYLISQEPWAKRVTLGNGDVSGSCPNHLRDPETDWMVSLDDYPNFSYSKEGWYPTVRNTQKTPYVKPHGSYFIVDAAHQPSLAYVPYLITGDYYYLEEVQWWANANLLSAGVASREGKKGYLWSGQVRGVAWSMRQLIHAAALSPDEGPGKKYFEKKLHSNLAWFKDFVDGKHAIYKPTNIGTYTPGAKATFTERKWKTQKRTYLTMAGWMHNFLTWAISHAAEQGYDDAIPMRDYLMKYTVGIAANPDKIPPHANHAYYLLVGHNSRNPIERRFAGTISELNRLNFHRPATEPKVVISPKVNSEYANAARANIITAFREGLPQSGKALQNINRIVGGRLDYRWAFEIQKK